MLKPERHFAAPRISPVATEWSSCCRDTARDGLRIDARTGAIRATSRCSHHGAPSKCFSPIRDYTQQQQQSDLSGLVHRNEGIDHMESSGCHRSRNKDFWRFRADVTQAKPRLFVRLHVEYHQRKTALGRTRTSCQNPAWYELPLGD